MSARVVIGQSPFADTSIAVGPFRSSAAALAASEDLDGKGWVTEIIELERVADVPYIVNDEGAARADAELDAQASR